MLAAADIEQLLGQLADVRPVRFGNAHHLGDHQYWKRRREIAHDVHAAAFLSLIEQVLDGALDKRTPLLQRFRREIAVHDLAHLQVIRPVVLDELVALVVADILVEAEIGLVDRRVGRPRIVLEHRRREQLVMPGQPDQVVVAGDNPEFVFLVPMHRVFIA